MTGLGPLRAGLKAGHVLHRGSVQVFVAGTAAYAVALISAPLQARALGPAGRGELATITAPAMLLSFVLSGNMQEYVLREVSQRRSPQDVIGEILPITLLLGVAGSPLMLLLGWAIARGRPVVFEMVALQAVLLPISLFSFSANFAAIGARRWGRVSLYRLLPQVLATLLLVALFVSHALTVRNAALVLLGTPILAVIIFINEWPGRSQIRLDVLASKRAARFGMTSLAGGAVALANQRLDVLLMTRLTTSAQLGLYVLATTISNVPLLVATSLAATGRGRIAAGEPRTAQTYCAFAVIGTAATGGALALLLPWAVPTLFGGNFASATIVAWVLLGADVPLAALTVLTAALITDGDPRAASLGDLGGLMVAVPLLILLVPSDGAMGAAIASLAGYSLSCVYVMSRAKTRFGGRWRDYVAIGAWREFVSFATHGKGGRQ